MSALGQKQTLRSSHARPLCAKSGLWLQGDTLTADLPPSAAAESDAQC